MRGKGANSQVWHSYDTCLSGTVVQQNVASALFYRCNTWPVEQYRPIIKGLHLGLVISIMSNRDVSVRDHYYNREVMGQLWG